MGFRAAHDREQVLATIHPHLLGMYPMYLVWMYLAGAGLAFMSRRHEWVPLIARHLNELIDQLGQVGTLNRWLGLTDRIAGNNEAYLAAWVAALVVPGLVLAVFRISLKWLVALGTTAALGIYLKEFSPLGQRGSELFVDNVENLTLIAVGLVGILGTEMYRRCHRYTLTDQRVIIEGPGIGGQTRSIFYGRIDDLVLSKPLLGSIFGFGSVIPITSSGLGLGSDSAGASALMGGAMAGASLGVAVTGSHSETVTRPSLAYTLFNVGDPEEVYELIASQVGRHAAC